MIVAAYVAVSPRLFTLTHLSHRPGDRINLESLINHEVMILIGAGRRI